MPTLIVTVGLPASGKTSFALGYLKTHKKTVRFNYDDTRTMMYGSGVFDGFAEDVVQSCNLAGAEAALNKGLDVVIDNTSLTTSAQERWRQLALRCKAKLQIEDFTKVPVKECISRDRLREPKVQVGRAVIENMALKAGLIEFGDKPIVIVDVDGTLADHEGVRGPYDEAKVHLDKPHELIVQWVNNLTHWHGYCMECFRSFSTDIYPTGGCTSAEPKPAPEYQVIIVSGRSTGCAISTEHWLDSRVTYSHLFMRNRGDRRADVEVKAEILEGILRKVPKEQIAFVIDDRPAVIRMWRQFGLRVFPARGQVEEF